MQKRLGFGRHQFQRWTYQPEEPARWISQQPLPVHINL